MGTDPGETKSIISALLRGFSLTTGPTVAESMGGMVLNKIPEEVVDVNVVFVVWW